MIRGLIRRPIAISMVYMVVAALGLLALRNVPVELLPDTSLPRLSVMAGWQGTSPEVVEAFLTAPLEGAIQQVRGVETITSRSQDGSAQIDVAFARETDMDFARLELSERLAAVEDDLPIGSTPPRVSMYVPEEFREQNRPVLEYTVSGPYLLEYLRQFVEDHVVPDLLQIEGVGALDVNGGRARVLEIELDERRITALGLSVATVSNRIRGMEIIREAGVVQAPSGLHLTVSIRQRAHTAAEVRTLPLLTDQGRIVRVDDVARVYDTFEEPTSHYRINAEPAVGLSIRKAARTNTVAMADEVRARVSELEAQLPPGMSMRLDRDQSVNIRTQLSDLRNRALIAAVIVLIVLLVFLRSLRAAVIVFSTVAFAVLITINILYFGGMTLNLLTLMGLAMGFGLVVDNAIVVLENIYRRRRRGEPAAVAAERGAREVVMPILAATGTTVVVLVPFVYLQGELRVYYVPLAIVVGLSLVASLFVAFTFIPSLGAKLLGAVRPHTRAEEETELDSARDDGLLPPMPTRAWYIALYGGLVRGTLRFPLLTILLVLMIFSGTGWLFKEKVTRGRVWGGGFGGDQQTLINISIRLPRGEELERVDELTRFFEDRLKQMPEVERFVTRVMNATSAQITVYFPEELELTDVPLAVEDQLYQYSLGYGGASVQVRGQGQRFYPGGSTAPNYSIKVLGYNYEKVRDIAEDLAARLKLTSSRIREVDTNTSGSFFSRDRATELVLDIDRDRLAMHDLTARQIVDQVGVAVRGRTSNQVVRVGGEELQFSVKLDGYRTMDMQQLADLLIPAPTGDAVRLGDVATLRERDVLNVVVRENQQYQRIVSYEFRGPARLGDRTKDMIVDNTALPPGYTIESQQSWSWDPEEKAQIYGVLLVSVLLIFMVTASVFESMKQPLCVLLTVPMALIGVFLLFWFTGASFTREAYVGVIMMGGIVVNNAILLVDHVNQLRRKYGLALREALERGTLERVRPILMTSLTTICGLLPLVLFSESADQNIWNALAYALIGGLSSSTVLVLTVTPALYLMFERRAERRRVAAADALHAEPAVQMA
ncbi:MAG TPA: efflux RND transporter permease subunit [Longimicrobiales bacterium]|nr:efflux RND transporter permease subunit [Longimicrobiales bacterium]